MTPTPAELEEFFQSYVTAALWSTSDDAKDCDMRTDIGGACEVCHGTGRVPDENSDGGEPFDAHFDVSDLAPETRDAMRADCLKFLEDHGTPDYSLSEGGRTAWTDLARAGHDFWLTRNGHGVGFWDRGFPDEIGDRYTKVAKEFGPFDLYLGDDGQIHGG